MIGIVDSGLGGLTVAKAVSERLPGYDIVYYGDTARMPYGNKSPQTIVRFVLEGVDLISRQGAALVVMACNSGASVAMEAVAGSFDLPIIDAVSPAAKLSVIGNNGKNKGRKNRIDTGRRIGVVGTRATIDSGVYPKMIKALDAEAKVYGFACPFLEPLVEEGWYKKPEAGMMIKKYLHPLKVKQIDTLILGSTHYTVLRRIMQKKIGKQIRIIDPSEAVVWKLVNFLKANPEIDDRLPKKGTSRFYASDITGWAENLAKRLFGRNLRLEQATSPSGYRLAEKT